MNDQIKSEQNISIFLPCSVHTDKQAQSVCLCCGRSFCENCGKLTATNSFCNICSLTSEKPKNCKSSKPKIIDEFLKQHPALAIIILIILLITGKALLSFRNPDIPPAPSDKTGYDKLTEKKLMNLQLQIFKSYKIAEKFTEQKKELNAKNIYFFSEKQLTKIIKIHKKASMIESLMLSLVYSKIKQTKTIEAEEILNSMTPEAYTTHYNYLKAEIMHSKKDYEQAREIYFSLFNNLQNPKQASAVISLLNYSENSMLEPFSVSTLAVVSRLIEIAEELKDTKNEIFFLNEIAEGMYPESEKKKAAERLNKIR